MGQAPSSPLPRSPPRTSSLSPIISPVQHESTRKPSITSIPPRPMLAKSASMDQFISISTSPHQDVKKSTQGSNRDRPFKSSFRVFRRHETSSPSMPMIDARTSYATGPEPHGPKSPKFLRFWSSSPPTGSALRGQMGPDEWHLRQDDGFGEYEESYDRRSMNVEELWWSYGRLCHTVPGVLYPLPADVEEIERNDNIHYMYQYITGGDSAIRATQVHRVLDVGCGSGQWLRGMAWSNPHGQYVGVDIVDSRKRNVRANPKIRFLRHDILSSPIPLADGSMDMIHQQFLQLAIPTDSWKKVLTEYHRILRPGGWCEVIEGGLVLQRPGPLGQRVNAYLHLVAKAVRVDLGLDDHIPQFFPQAGLSDLRRTEIPCGIGSWAGPQGSFGVKTLLGLVEALNDRLCAMGIPQEEVEEVLEGLADEVDIWETYTIFIHWLSSKPAAQSPWDS